MLAKIATLVIVIVVLVLILTEVKHVEPPQNDRP
jgi:hypothetical protein